MKYKFNPFITLYYSLEKQALVLFEPIKKKVFEIEKNLFLDLVKSGEGGLSKQEIEEKIRKLLKIKKEQSSELVESLIQSDILSKQTNLLKLLEKKKEEWFSYGWGSSFYYHLASKDFKFLDYSKTSEILKDQDLMKEYVKESKPPAIYKEYKKSKFYPLIDPKKLKVVKFSPNSKINGGMNLESLSYILYYTFGEIFSANFPVVGKILAKTSPSGGARHPSEAYVLVLKDIGIPKGVYHYSVKRNGLEFLSKIDEKGELKKQFYKTTHIQNFNPEVIIVVSTIFERNMWRYREIRTFRVIFFDIGHLLSTLRIIVGSLGLDVLINHSFNDSYVQRLLSLTNGRERPLYCAIIGNNKKGCK